MIHSRGCTAGDTSRVFHCFHPLLSFVPEIPIGRVFLFGIFPLKVEEDVLKLLFSKWRNILRFPFSFISSQLYAKGNSYSLCALFMSNIKYASPVNPRGVQSCTGLLWAAQSCAELFWVAPSCKSYIELTAISLSCIARIVVLSSKWDGVLGVS